MWRHYYTGTNVSGCLLLFPIGGGVRRRCRGSRPNRAGEGGDGAHGGERPAHSMLDREC